MKELREAEENAILEETEENHESQPNTSIDPSEAKPKHKKVVDPVKKFLNQVPPDFDKAEIHGVRLILSFNKCVTVS